MSVTALEVYGMGNCITSVDRTVCHVTVINISQKHCQMGGLRKLNDCVCVCVCVCVVQQEPCDVYSSIRTL